MPVKFSNGKLQIKAAGRFFYQRTLQRIANAAGASVREVVEFIDADWPYLEQHREWIAGATIREIEGWVVAGLVPDEALTEQ